MNNPTTIDDVHANVLESIATYRDQINRIKSSLRLSIGALAILFSNVDSVPDFMSFDQVSALENDIRRVINHLHTNIDDIDICEFEIDRALYRARLERSIINGRNAEQKEEK